MDSDLLLRRLIPVRTFTSGFTTSTQICDEKIKFIFLDDAALGVHKIASRTTHPVVVPPEPTLVTDIYASSQTPTNVADGIPNPVSAWEAFYPKGSINPSGTIPGGFGFYLSGPQFFSKDLENASEVIFSYRMMLQEGWEWVIGGKLPGIFGGIGNLSYGCTGGRQEERCQCFDLRLMWRKEGDAELYSYLPLTEENKRRQKSIPPKSIENPGYGFSVGRGAYDLCGAVGNWVALALRVKLNDFGVNNGEVELWLDGKSVIRLDNISIRESKAGRVRGMHFQTFFGGHTAGWATPKDQRAWFADITGVIVR